MIKWILFAFIGLAVLLIGLLLWKRQINREFSKVAYLHATLRVELCDFYENNMRYPESLELVLSEQERKRFTEELTHIKYENQDPIAFVHWDLPLAEKQYFKIRDGLVVEDTLGGKP